MKTLRETILEQFNYCNEIADDIIRHNASKEIIKYAHNWAEIESPVSKDIDMPKEIDAPWVRICFGDIYIFMFLDEDALDKEDKVILTGQMRYQLDGFGEYGGETIDVDSKEKWMERFNELTDEELLEQHLEVFDDDDYSCQCPIKYEKLD